MNMSELSLITPPILPNIEEELRSYLLHPRPLPIHDNERSQQLWPRVADPSALYNCEPSTATTTLGVHRDLTTGSILGVCEVSSDGSKIDLTDQRISVEIIPDLLKSALDLDIGFNEELLKVPPSFSRGFEFELDKSGEKELTQNTVINLANILRDYISLEEDDKIRSKTESPTGDSVGKIDLPPDADELIEKLTDYQIVKAPVLKISELPPAKGITSTEWAEMIDISQPVLNFNERIPNMAFKYEFELDTFQKQAILKLEERCNVLVAAHTSAGKTVVAEYAIALSQKHLTRSIYTSPIKALSNQKYREFKQTFNDVGLITGDFQINQTGTCLIMTTEILRAMLLQQSEVIRDLEFVIFDEIHYINDMDRGHVWEEVLILLPHHVSIVMLSATVPNTLEFADWVGRTKRRRMYVISTPQRPVPLMHYLYLGTGGNNRDDRFLILDKTVFLRQGYLQAVEADKKRQGKNKDGAPKKRLPMGPKQEQTMWVALFGTLATREELPVVVFTLSRKRCDSNADNLVMDLTTSKEKHQIKMFYEKSIQRLNEADRNLPQILRMQELLEKGIGVHHSGILPIVKEIVELLFQERLVKVLFATETFAMGVNMPAKTVVFDSIVKFDGITQRTLLPSEYIQMAGRAGRRGLDATGTVLILCKNEVFLENELLSMMTGLPRKIESQFRLTYSIILKLERKRVAAEGRVSVEEMMANSFMEADHMKKKSIYQEKMKDVDTALAEAKVSITKNNTWQEYTKSTVMLGVAEKCLEFLELWNNLSKQILASKYAMKYMTPGRVVVLSHEATIILGILISSDFKRVTKYRVFILADQFDSPKSGDAVDDIMKEFKRALALTRTTVTVPESLGAHCLTWVNPSDILDILNTTIKFDSKLIVNDWENRQIPRFKNNPPGQSFQRLMEELLELTHRVQTLGLLETVPIIENFETSNVTDFNNAKRLIALREELKGVSVIDWETGLEYEFRIRHLEKQKEKLAYLLSYQSMSLYEDYQSRLQVLRDLNYVDSRNSVQMKGNVACEMSNHELLITELVLRNALNDLQPAEIAAILSCFVYQGKDSGQPLRVTANLAKVIEIIQEVEMEVRLAEQRYQVLSQDPNGIQKGLNFELVPIVYEWAMEKPFAQIMALTDIQEGIIVRCIQQLNEVLRDVRNAARIIGEPTLQRKMEDASAAIKRDIVFAASLYMQ